MDKVLLVCSSEKGEKVYLDNLKAIGFNHIDIAKSGSCARRKLISHEYKIVIIDTPLKDEYGSDLAIQLSEKGSIGLVLIVKAGEAVMIGQKVEEHGIFVISKPFTKSNFYQGIKI